MKKLLLSLIAVLTSLPMLAQGWPSQYEGVMLQAFYWDSYDDSQWKTLEKQADELSKYFKLVWIPQSGNCGGTSMGYDDLYWFPDGNGSYTSSFGTETQLRNMINTFKSKGIGTIADVVINHRRNVSNWVDFPKETYKGVTYEMKSTDICANDDGGQAKTEAAKLGLSVSSNNDTGEDWGGMRDLDHKSDNVQTIVKAYLKMLLEDLGYVGFRYDMVKGYGGEYTKIYNEYSNPTYSVGECWDGTNTIKNWIDKTEKTSAAFDFQFKYIVRNAANSQTWNKLNQANDASYSLIHNTNSAYRRYAITFVENHDTELRPDGSSNGPLEKDTLAANAYMLAMPGTPCVFMKHWQACKEDIKAMIDVRNFVGIHNESTYTLKATNANYYGVETTGKNGKLICMVGKGLASYNVPAGYTQVLSGYHYAYWMQNSMETAWVNRGSGDFTDAFDVTLTAVSATSGAQVVYTTDGSTPSASNGTKAASGTKIKISTTTTLKVGLLKGSTVSGIVTREFNFKEPEVVEIEIPDFCTITADEVCAFFEAPDTWENTIMCWAWSDSPAENFTSATGSWPGKACELVGTAKNGNKVYKWTWDGTRQHNTTVAQPAKIIFSNNGSPQSADLTFTNHGYYVFDTASKGKLFGVVTNTSGISTITADKLKNARIYTLDGRLVNSSGSLNGLSKGVYIMNGKKYVIR